MKTLNNLDKIQKELLVREVDAWVLPDYRGSNEIFGALAAAADTFRTATVVARERSIVVSVPKEGFLSIIETRPATTLKLIQDMARSIVALNKTVVKLS